MFEVCEMVMVMKHRCEIHKLRAHGGAPTFIFQYCGNVCKNNYYFDGHMDVNEKGEEAKEFYCEYCGKISEMGRYRRTHVRRTRKDVVYKCFL